MEYRSTTREPLRFGCADDVRSGRFDSQVSAREAGYASRTRLRVASQLYSSQSPR